MRVKSTERNNEGKRGVIQRKAQVSGSAPRDSKVVRVVAQPFWSSSMSDPNEEEQGMSPKKSMGFWAKRIDLIQKGSW